MGLITKNPAIAAGLAGAGIQASILRREATGDDAAAPRKTGSSGITPHTIAKPVFYNCLREITAQISPNANIAELYDPEIPAGGMRIVPAREWVAIFDRLARELNCPDFGLRSARLESATGDDNPFLLAQCNAETVSDAIKWAERSSRAVGRAFQIKCTAPSHAKWAVIEYHLMAGDALRRRQAVEYGVAMIFHRLMSIAEPPRACEIWFSHQPVSPRHVYAEHFRVKIRFGRPCNAILVNREYLSRPIPNRRPGVLEVARFYIETHLPDGGLVLQAEAERIAARLLVAGRCELDELASELGMHPRTLQRRLREEGTSFFEVKDGAQRVLALSFLRDASLSVKHIAMRLGYSAGSGFTRSCVRWFSACPRDVRARLAVGADDAELSA